MKKADLAWDKIGKLILILAVLIILIAISLLFKDKIYQVLDGLKEFLRFGT